MYPMLTPLLALLRSRKMMVAVTFLLAQALILAVPALEAYRESLHAALLIFGSVLIAAIAYEDGQAKGAPLSAEEAAEAIAAGPQTPAEAGKQIVVEAVEEIFGQGEG